MNSDEGIGDRARNCDRATRLPVDIVYSQIATVEVNHIVLVVDDVPTQALPLIAEMSMQPNPMSRVSFPPHEEMRRLITPPAISVTLRPVDG
jgi:hypothetical protein